MDDDDDEYYHVIFSKYYVLIFSQFSIHCKLGYIKYTMYFSIHCVRLYSTQCWLIKLQEHTGVGKESTMVVIFYLTQDKK